MPDSLIVKTILMVALAIGLPGCGRFAAAKAAADKSRAEIAAQDRALAEIYKLRIGIITRDKKMPGAPVVGLEFMGYTVTDAAMAYLKYFTQLRELELHNTKVTDAGLKQIKGLTQLQKLSFAGVIVLHGPRGTVDDTLFGNTHITDAGLEHLRGLTQLRELNLSGIRVTEAAVNELRKALPNTRIIPPSTPPIIHTP